MDTDYYCMSASIECFLFGENAYQRRNKDQNAMKGVLIMSTITKTWTEDKIRSIIRKLDEKTRLNGAALPIAF